MSDRPAVGRHHQGSATPGVSLMLVLLSAMAAGPMFNYGISTLSALLIQDFGVTAGQVGFAVTVVFASAAVTSLYLGRLADKWSPRVQLAFIFLGTTVALILAASAWEWSIILIAAVIAGPTQAISNPTTNRIIMSHVPFNRRMSWIGVKQSGVQAAQLFAGLFCPAVALLFGWTGAALGLATVVLLMWLWSLAVVPTQPKEPQFVPTNTSPTPKVEVVQGSAPIPRVVYFFALISLLSGFGMQATNIYLPLFSIEAAGFSLVMAGMVSAASGVIGVASRIGWSRAMQAGNRPSILLMIISVGAVLGVLTLVLASFTRQGWLIWLAATLHGLTALGANVVTNAGLMKFVPQHRIGVASGISSMGMYTGFATGPLVVGLLRDATGDFFVGWVLVAVCYLLTGILALVLYLSSGSTGQAAQ